MRCALFLPLLAMTVPVTAQDVPAATPAPPAAEPVPLALGDVMRFGTDGPRMTVPVSIAGAGPFGFIIDTGAQRTVISRELARTLGLASGRTVRLTAMTGTSDVATVVIPSIRVSTLGGGRIEAPALSVANLGASGMLGIDTLQGHAVSIDFDRKQMLVRTSTRRNRRVDALPNEIVIKARNLLGQLVVTDAFCDGQRVKVILDTGSVVSMGNPELRRRFARRNRPTVPIALTSVTGDTLTADYGEIDRIKIGDLGINHLPMAFADAPPFHQFGLDDTPAILLGMDALRLFRRVQIDFANREVRLALPREAGPAPMGSSGRMTSSGW